MYAKHIKIKEIKKENTSKMEWTELARVIQRLGNFSLYRGEVDVNEEVIGFVEILKNVLYII